jgi:eukaryotic translation initiation factor 2C
MEPFMVIGIDVTHSAQGRPSITAMVGSLDPLIVTYGRTVGFQKALDKRGKGGKGGGKGEADQGEAARKEMAAQEVISQERLQEMLKDLLSQFRARNGAQCTPRRLIVYRDGVSEGEMIQIVEHEVRAIQGVFEEMEERDQPKLTFLTGQKKHGKRLFPAGASQYSGNGGGKGGKGGDDSKFDNVRPGTITEAAGHPVFYDFLLNSHGGLKGTNRVAHYQVLYDANFNSQEGVDRLQMLTYYLSYAYGRCTKAVGKVAPSYQAHLLASQARIWAGYGDDSDYSSTDAEIDECPSVQVPRGLAHLGLEA